MVNSLVDDTNQEPWLDSSDPIEFSIYAPMATYEGNDPSCPGGSYGYDTDGDGTLDIYDSDDDCDYLSDDLEIQKIGSNTKDRDHDNDQTIDGFDVRPLGSVSLTIDIDQIKNLDDGMDCCWSAKWGDPYFSYSRVFFDTGIASEVLTFSGLSLSNHPHNAQTYTFGNDGIDTIYPVESINDWIRAGVTDYPHFDMRLTLKDHDNQYDDLYDINDVAGAATLSALLNLWDIASSPGKIDTFIFDGGADGNSNEAAKLTVKISTNADPCAIKSAMKVSQGDALVLPGEVSC